MTWLLTFLWLIAAQSTPLSTTTFTVEQNGRTVPVQNNQVALKRAPFTLVFRMPASNPTVYVRASIEPDIFNAATTGRPLDEWFAFGFSMAEGVFNDERLLWLTPPTESVMASWYADNELDNRCDDGSSWSPTLVICRRTVETIVAQRVRTRIQDFKARELYIVAVIGRTALDRPLAEEQRQAVKITFR